MMYDMNTRHLEALVPLLMHEESALLMCLTQVKEARWRVDQREDHS